MKVERGREKKADYQPSQDCATRYKKYSATGFFAGIPLESCGAAEKTLYRLAGPSITIPTLESWLTLSNGTGVSGVVRTIPNTPVSLRQGATAVIASQRVTAVQLDRVVDLFRIISPCVGILSEENLLNAAVAISGYGSLPCCAAHPNASLLTLHPSSGPAYILQF